MNVEEIKERYDYDNPNGDFFFESINCAETVQRAKDFRRLIDEVERLTANVDELCNVNNILFNNFNEVAADKAKLTTFINVVKISADRPYLRQKAEKLLEKI